MESVVLVLIGGLVSMISAAVTVLLQHRWERQKLDIQSRQHFTQIVYAKQTEFFDKVYPILGKINSYITAIIVWLEEKGENDKSKSNRTTTRIRPVMDLYQLIEQYYVYLPKGLLEAANELVSLCMSLNASPDMKGADECMESWFSFQNVMREFAGIDKLSTDLMKAFGREH